jgi:hypothetical protein
MVYNEALRHSLRYATVYVTPQSTLRYILRYATTNITDSEPFFITRWTERLPL